VLVSSASKPTSAKLGQTCLKSNRYLSLYMVQTSFRRGKLQKCHETSHQPNSYREGKTLINQRAKSRPVVFHLSHKEDGGQVTSNSTDGEFRGQTDAHDYGCAQCSSAKSDHALIISRLLLTRVLRRYGCSTTSPTEMRRRHFAA